MSAHTHYEGLASILNYLPTVVHCNFDQHLRSNYPDILQVALVGIYAIYFHAYARTPSLAEAKDDDAIQLILLRLRYPTFTIPLHIKIAQAPVDALVPGGKRFFDNGLVVLEERIGAELPSTTQRFTVSPRAVPTDFAVAEGVYLALELIHSHYTQIGQNLHPRGEIEATLALFLHSIVLLAPSRQSLKLPTQTDAYGRVTLFALQGHQVEAIQRHPEFAKWRGTVAAFVNVREQRQRLVESASHHYYEYMRWRDLLNGARYDQSAQGFKQYLMDSLEQIRGFLEPLLPRTLPSLSQAPGEHESNELRGFPPRPEWPSSGPYS